MGARTLVVIPTFNEVLNIQELYQRIRSYDSDKDLLFVDSNSLDGTQQVIEEIMKNDKKVFILKYAKKEGLGRAYISGFLWGINMGYDWFQQIDADLSHDPVYLRDFDRLKSANKVIVASRYIKSGGVEKWGFCRRLLSFLGCFYLRLIFQCNLHDLTGGFNCWHRDVISGIDLNRIVSRGFVFQSELKFKAFKKGFKIIEFPYIFKERKKGQSKINYRIILEGLFMPIIIRLNRRS